MSKSTEETNTDRWASATSAAASGTAAALPKRFYTEVSVSDMAPYEIHLDHRAVKTPRKAVLAVPSKPLADAISSEWQAQTTVIDPSTMPLTRFVNSAIDVVSANRDRMIDDVVAYAGNDLLCYRAEEPDDLCHLQAQQWDPVVRWAGSELGHPLVLAAGLMPVEQPQSALDQLQVALQPADAFELAAVHVMTTLTGSALLAFAHYRGIVSADDAWAAAHVDEDFQISRWGEDSAAMARRQARERDFHAAARLLDLLRRG